MHRSDNHAPGRRALRAGARDALLLAGLAALLCGMAVVAAGVKELNAAHEARLAGPVVATPAGRLEQADRLCSGKGLDKSSSSIQENNGDRRWTIKLVRATRELPEISIGASVRGSLALERAARAWALLDGRSYTTPQDVERMFAPVLGHRFVFSPAFIAESRGRTKDEILQEVYRRCAELAPPPELEQR